MNVYFDTSALIKHYIVEKGSNAVNELLRKADTVFVSVLTDIEARSTFRRLFAKNAIDFDDYSTLKREFEKDFKYFETIHLSDEVYSNAKELIEKHQLKTLDSIQLSCALTIASSIDLFASCDNKLLLAAEKEKIAIINPAD